MKRWIYVLLLLILVGCSQKVEYTYPETTIADMTGYQGLVSQQFYQETISHFLEMVEQKKTAIVYFGYDSCIWCNCLVPVLNEVSIEKQLPVYYIDHHQDENRTDFEGIEKVTELLSDFLDKDEAGEISFYFPTVVFLQEGKVIDVHVGTVSGHDATVSDLTEKQQARLKYILEKAFDGLFVR